MSFLRCRRELILGVAVMVVALIFAAVTQHAWEDYWITFRASRNLATGNGLVYTVGDRLHTFTSPLGVLLPAAFCKITGARSDELVLWLFRITSSAALASGVILLFRTLQSLKLRPLPLWLTLGWIALDAKIVDFSINGMETGILVLFLATTIHGLLVPGRLQILRIGAGWGGLMWTRPDSCVYIALLSLGTVLFVCGKTAEVGREMRPVYWRKLTLAGLVCTALYLPWFVWAWAYYGTPVPHTVVAKGTNLPPISPEYLLPDLLLYPIRLLQPFHTSMQFAFMPAYAVVGGWDWSLVYANDALGIVAAFLWMLPWARPQARLFSFVFFFGNFFLTDVLKYFVPWYIPSVSLMGYLAIGLGLDQALAWSETIRAKHNTSWTRHWLAVFRGTGVVLILGQLAVTICVAQQMRVQQALIENGLRRQIGLWLRAHARTQNDTVMLEPLGYIGYFSGLRMLDAPGLVSREVVAERKRLGPGGQAFTFVALKPDWLVLRPFEAAACRGPLEDMYDYRETFDASAKVAAVHWLPGRPYLFYDQTFLIFHIKTNTATATSTTDRIAGGTN